MRKINKIIKLTIILLDLIGLVLIINKKIDCTLIKWLLLTISVILPNILRSMKISIKDNLEMLYLILIFLSFTLGRIYNLYDTIKWYNTLVHFVSGKLTFIFGLILLKMLKKYDKKITFNIIFGILVTITLATIWELTEFSIDKLLNKDMQDVIKSGVDDTMKDIIVAIISAILAILSYIYENKKNKKGLITIIIADK